MKSILTIIMFLSFTICVADGGFSFFAGKYYFELDYGLSFDPTTRKHEYRNLHQSYVPNSKISHIKCDKITRVNRTSQNTNFRQYTDEAKLAYNSSKSLIIAAVGEFIFVLTPEFQVQSIFRNVYFKEWINDEEVLVTSEDGSGGSVYGTSDYFLQLINFEAKLSE